MTQPLKVGLIGLGVGERHLTGYRKIEGVEVHAICDIDPAKLADVGNRHDVARRTTDWRELTEDAGIDAVSICSYDDAHAEQAVTALRAGKHVMVEKPVALNRSDLERIVRAQQDSGRIVTSNFVLRRSPRFSRIRDMARAGEFGDLFYLEGDYLHQILWKITQGWRGKMDFYCVTYGGGVHLIDLMRWIVGGEVEEVTAMASKRLTRDTAFPYPDTMVSLLRFEGDILAKTTTSFGTRRPIMHTLNVYGSEASFENAVPEGRLFRSDQPDSMEVVTEPYPAFEKGDMLPDFVAAIREGREPAVGARDVFRVMDICFACWESVVNRRTVPVTYSI